MSVDVDGDVAVVGLPFGGLGLGESARVYRHGGAGWALEAVLTAAGGATGDAFGSSVTIDGDVIVAGSPFDGLPGVGARGLGHRVPLGRRELERGAGAHGRHGIVGRRLVRRGGVGVGDLLAVGAPFDDRLGDDAGAAAVFAWNDGAWELETLLLPPARAAGDAFGVSLAMSDGTVAVGTPFRDVHGAVDQGMVYVFTP